MVYYCFAIDDEPVDGPSCYILVTGFTSADLYKELDTMKLSATALVNIFGSKELLSKATSKYNNRFVARFINFFGTGEPFSEQFSKKFMPDLMSLINSSAKGSMLRDMALLDLSIPHCEVTDAEQQVVCAFYRQTE